MEKEKTDWLKTLVASAMIGAARKPLDPAMRSLLETWGIDLGGEPEKELGRAVAAATQIARASLPLEDLKTDVELPTPQPDEKYPGLKATKVFIEMLDSIQAPQCYPTLLRLLEEKGYCLSPAMLFALLDDKWSKANWDRLEPLLGTRGRWFLSMHPQFRELVSVPDEEKWQGGTRQERLALFIHLRRRDPHGALALLQRGWEKEKPADKAAFLEKLAMGLSMHDEPFLEQCLHNGRAPERRVAASLLASLPDSRLVQRMCQRLDSWITWDGYHLSFDTPEEPDPEAQRDGIAPVAPQWQGGPKAACLGQVASLVPPEWWCEKTGLQPEAVLQVFLDSDWAGTLTEAVARAAIRFRRPAWAKAILMLLPAHEKLPLWKKDFSAQLAALLPADSFEDFALALLRSQADAVEAARLLLPFLQQSPSDLTPALAKELMNRFAAWAEHGSRRPWETSPLGSTLEMIGLKAPVDMSEELATAIDSNSLNYYLLERPLRRMVEYLLLRKELIRLLNDAQ